MILAGIVFRSRTHRIEGSVVVEIVGGMVRHVPPAAACQRSQCQANQGNAHIRYLRNDDWVAVRVLPFRAPANRRGRDLLNSFSRFQRTSIGAGDAQCGDVVGYPGVLGGGIREFTGDGVTRTDAAAYQHDAVVYDHAAGH